jgi:hypothetical protein
MSMKNSNDTIGSRTRDLPVCGAVPQPTAPPRTPVIIIIIIIIVKNHESTQRNMNSIIKSAAKFIEELSQLEGKSDEKQDEIQHTKQDWERF